MYPSIKYAPVFLLAAALPMSSLAETRWSDNSLSLLYGSDHKVGEDDRTTLTLEHVSGHNWGDVFVFVDRLNSEASNTENKETYAEISPRLSMSYLSGNKLGAGPVRDVYLAGTYEFQAADNGLAGFDNYLYGVGLDWQVPGFQYVQTQFFYVVNESTENDLQMTVVWGAPIELGAVRVLFDGYMDWSSAEKDHASDFHFNPQLKLDVGHFFGITGKIYAGVEYSYWHNKFGLKDNQFPGLGKTEEDQFSALLKVHL